MTTLIFNLLLTCLIGSLAYLLLSMLNDIRETKRMYGQKIYDIEKQVISTNNKFLLKYQSLIQKVLTEKKLEKYASLVYYSILIISALLILCFVNMNQLFMAVVSPIVINLFTIKVFQTLEDDLDEKMEDQLPNVIDTMIRIFTKYGDLKSVIYETSLVIENPLGQRLENLSRKMASDTSQEKAMLDFAENINNIWVYSLFSILLSYKEDAKKEDTIDNLRNLRDIVSKENELKNQLVSSKNYGIGVNYFIAGAAFLGSILNIFLNPVGVEFFFHSINGMICLLIGYGAVFSTIIINIGMSKKKRKKV